MERRETENKNEGILAQLYKRYLYLRLPDELKSLEEPDKLLLESAKIGNKTGIRYSLLTGADVNARDNGWTALMYAAENGDTKTAKLLIKKGADMNTKDNWGETALTRVVEKGNTETAELLIEKGADINTMSCKGTLLMCAVNNGDIEMVELLIKKGVDINAKDKYFGKTALIDAAQNGNTKIAKLLIQNGADIDLIDESGRTALIWAAWNGHTETAELLIEKGADVLYAYKIGGARQTINQIAREKPELFTEEQKLLIYLYSNPRNIPQNKRKEVLKLLREFQKKGIITKEKSLELFTKFQKEGNNKIGELQGVEMRKPKNKPNEKGLRKAVQ
ncbi:ankyrin repeat domain-containing protein [Candidatus Micrarchaeota archaeon]|nr:ankyrin repeat domain-containing protein [Candidatus Micrarchaeota archaeon]